MSKFAERNKETYNNFVLSIMNIKSIKFIKCTCIVKIVNVFWFELILFVHFNIFIPWQLYILQQINRLKPISVTCSIMIYFSNIVNLWNNYFLDQIYLGFYFQKNPLTSKGYSWSSRVICLKKAVYKEIDR